MYEFRVMEKLSPPAAQFFWEPSAMLKLKMPPLFQVYLTVSTGFAIVLKTSVGNCLTGISSCAQQTELTKTDNMNSDGSFFMCLANKHFLPQI
jgi:hypothetical protein